MKLIAILFAGATLAIPCHAGGDPAQLAQSKTPVEVQRLQVQGEMAELEAVVRGATNQSQVVILTRQSGRPGLRVAANQRGEPMVPRTSESLPSSNFGSASHSPSRWNTRFFVRPSDGRLQEVFVVVCTVRERTDWNKSRDYRGFQYLPFDRAKDIDDALDLLRDFGWMPTGVTSVSAR